MKLLYVFLLSFSLAQAAGFHAETIVKTADGTLKPIREIAVGDQVLCFDKEFKQKAGIVLGTAKIDANSLIHITTEDGITIIAESEELLFDPEKKEWVMALNFTTAHHLLNSELKSKAISAINQSSEPAEICIISVDEEHNFFASDGEYLVHNGPIAAWQAYWGTKTLLYGLLGLAIGSTIFVTGGTVAAASSAVGAGTITAGSGLVAAGSAVTGATVGAVATGSTTMAAAVGVTTAVGTMALGAEAGAAAAACATGLSGMVSVASATAGSSGAAGICYATSAAIEVAAASAFTAALTCPWTPW